MENLIEVVNYIFYLVKEVIIIKHGDKIIPAIIIGIILLILIIYARKTEYKRK